MDVIIDIEKRLGDFRLHVKYEGEKSVIGILGSSGCGKSMTLKSIAGIETPDRGRIAIEGRTLYDSSARINLKPQKRRVGYLFQNYALFPTMTVEQNIMAGLTGSRADNRRRAAEMMHRFQIEELGNHYPGQLSGGQQQRAALARIMAYEPRVLLLDEPFSAMDVFLRERLRLEMAEVLNTYPGPSILVTHDREEAYQLCSQLMVMSDGQIIDAGPTKELFEHPRTVQSARLTGCKNLSRIEQIGDHRVRALDWYNLELTIVGELTPEITHIGIRAHDFMPVDQKEFERIISDPGQRMQANPIPVEAPCITEMPFEWYITLRQGLWWKQPKDMHIHRVDEKLPYGLTISPDKIMLLRS